MTMAAMKKSELDKFKKSFIERLQAKFSVSPDEASDQQVYQVLSEMVVEVLKNKRRQFINQVNSAGKKQVYYLSMEFLMGRSLKTSLYNLEMVDGVKKILDEFDINLDKIYEYEPDAGLGNGGLGRLAACYLDGMATQAMPAMGHSICYEYGIFKQKLEDGWQTELPDNWLPGGSVWLDPKPERAIDTNTEVISSTYGHIICTVDLSVNEGIVESYDKIMSAINTTKASGIYPYLLFIYITHELVTLSYREQVFDKISEKSSELFYFISAKDTYYPQTNNGYLTNSTFMTNKIIHVDNVDDYHDNIIQKIVEGCSITRIKSTEWERNIGTTNDTMIANQFADTDEIHDKVMQSNIDVVSIDSDERMKYKIYEEQLEFVSITGQQHAFRSLVNRSSLNNDFILNDGINFNVDSKFVDRVKNTIKESKAICSDITTTWATIGTNSAILNAGFVTNMFMQSDECIDIIQYS